MRIVFTSDLHADHGSANAGLVPHLARSAAALSPDILILVGDVADRAACVGETLSVFRGIGALRVYVAGNHDLYVEAEPERTVTSREKFESVLPRVAADSGFEYLGIDPVRWRGLAIVGTPGWWDATLRDPDLDVVVHPDHYRAGSWRTQRSFDRGSILWPRSGAIPPPGSHPASVLGDWAGDEEICDHMLGRLDEQIARSAGTSTLLAAVHVLPCIEAVERHAFGPSAFHDATLGSVRFGERLRAEPRTRAVLTGHLHRPRTVRLGDLQVISRPVGRRHVPRLDPAAIAASCLGVLEID